MWLPTRDLLKQNLTHGEHLRLGAQILASLRRSPSTCLFLSENHRRVFLHGLSLLAVDP